MEEYLQELNHDQKNAVTHTGSPLMIVAGAGTGKTTVITRRMLWLLHSPAATGRALDINEVLALTFTEKAAGEMEHRVLDALPMGYRELWISTFHSFCERILRAHAFDIGLEDDFELLTPLQSWMLVRNHFSNFDLEYYRPRGNPTKFIHALLNHFSRAKDEAVEPDDYMKFVESLKLDRDAASNHLGPDASGDSRVQEILRLEEVARAYAQYEQLMRQRNAMDFGGLVVWTLKLLKARPQLLERYRNQFKAILVDEFQDTNWTQYALVKLLAGTNPNFTVVADDDQAIYRWRGASFNNVIQFKKDFPHATEVVLTQNYRSGQAILDRAYEFIQHNNPNRLEAQLHHASAAFTQPLSKKLRSTTDQPGAIIHHHASTIDEETLIVARTINDLVMKQQARWSDIAVLVRSNNDAYPFVQAFARENIPFELVSTRGLYQKPIVIDVLSYLRLLIDHHDSVSCWRVLSMEIVGMSASELALLSHIAAKKNWPLMNVLEQVRTLGCSAHTIDRVEWLLSLIRRHSELAKRSTATEVMLAFLYDSGILEHLQQQESSSAIKALHWLEQLYGRVQEFTHHNVDDASVRVFNDHMHLALESGDEGDVTPVAQEEHSDAVQVMTIHAAKGLEFPYVFLVSLVDRRFPTTRRVDPIELPEALMKELLPQGDWHLEEERRLMYVAMTRAKRALYLTHADHYGGIRPKRPSLFLQELGLVNEKKESRIKNKGSEMRNVNNETQNKESIAKSDRTAPLSLPERFSYTQLKAFETCPLQYKFAHVLRIPVRGHAPLSFGKSMHKTLELFFRQMINERSLEQPSLFVGGSTTTHTQAIEELLKLYEQSWINEWYDSAHQRDEYYQRGQEILKTFFSSHHGHWPTSLYLEHPFVLKLDGRPFKGVIDRIDVLSSPSSGITSVEIIDYKTGTPRTKEEVGFEQKEQLFLYQLAVETLWKELKPERLTLYYLENNTTVSFIASADELNAVAKRVTNIAVMMESSDFSATPDKQKCVYCDFKAICEFRTL